MGWARGTSETDCNTDMRKLLRHYLLVYNAQQHSLIDLYNFSSKNGEQALDTRFWLERKYADSPDITIVYLMGTSVASLRATHSRYFI